MNVLLRVRIAGHDLLGVPHPAPRAAALHHLRNADWGALLAAGEFGLGEDVAGSSLLELTRTPDEESTFDGRVERVEDEYKAVRTAFSPTDAAVAALS